MLDEREALLRAIFDAPDDDLPRLVYADWLDEHGHVAHAELIRFQCELARRPVGQRPTPQQYERQAQLIRETSRLDNAPANAGFPGRGFRFCEELALSLDELADRDGLRELAVTRRPEWYAATHLRLTAGPLQTTAHVAGICESRLFDRVRKLDLSGGTTVVPNTAAPAQALPAILASAEFRYEPRVTLPGLVALVAHPWVRRLTSLNLRNNDLGNDALTVLERAPHLIRLTELDISQGNRFRGRVWQRLIQRFGEEVVS